jgi:hypothetical protein
MRLMKLIEAMYPELPKIELFVRHARATWAAWGKRSGNSAALLNALAVGRCHAAAGCPAVGLRAAGQRRHRRPVGRLPEANVLID